MCGKGIWIPAASSRGEALAKDLKALDQDIPANSPSEVIEDVADIVR